MDSGLTIRTTGNASQTSHAPAPVRQAVATDLASSQTVTAASGAANVRNDCGPAHPFDPSRPPSVILDAQSREIIDRGTSEPSRRVVRQMPEIAARRLKAYTRPARHNGDALDEHADFEV
ncbi:MAG: hypothetical protein E6G97_02270 [Alphaproteobacteria bacterium]|nr:MAG: hypothetical protein E6G97_02270 [Alphaproteobacteria bacterium]